MSEVFVYGKPEDGLAVSVNEYRKRGSAVALYFFVDDVVLSKRQARELGEGLIAAAAPKKRKAVRP